MNIRHFQVRKGTSYTAHKPSMKSVRFNFSKRITAASAVLPAFETDDPIPEAWEADADRGSPAASFSGCPCWKPAYNF